LRKNLNQFNQFGVVKDFVFLDKTKQESKKLLNLLNISNSDEEIVIYLTEIIKEQQMRDLYKVAPTVKLDLSVCQTFSI
jgi:hypothetical protein